MNLSFHCLSISSGVSCGGDDSPATVIHLETNPKKEREFGIPVTDLSTLAIGHIHQCHDHLTQTHERSVDATGFLEKEKC